MRKIGVNGFKSGGVESQFPDSVTTISDGTTTTPSYSTSPLVKMTFGKGLTTITGDHPFIDHHFYDKDGNELDQTVKNLEGHTFVGTEASKMVMDDGATDKGFPIWAIAAMALAILAVIVGLVLWKRSR